ncbi:MAG: hypothetical protein R6V45_13230 [Oceanipulchritudo sp.]
MDNLLERLERLPVDHEVAFTAVTGPAGHGQLAWFTVILERGLRSP